ncbi:hypothetical protein [Actinoplanes sp. NPDC089786]|uniref:hypothetical protein n=1 Tax=Actinoplanes sp. NPDC089786 TaxID=3155185 RepID=UPI003419BD8A
MRHQQNEPAERSAPEVDQRPRFDNAAGHHLLDIQRTAGNRATVAYLQRQPVAGTAIVHEHQQLTPELDQTNQLLDRLIPEQGWEATSAWAYRFINADPLGDLKYGGDLDLVGRCRQRLRTEIKQRQAIADDLTGPAGADLGDVVFAGGRFITTANKVTTELLDRSQKQLTAEMAHYGLKENTFLGITTGYEMNDGPVQQGLRDAARRLAARRRETNKLSKAFFAAQQAAEDDARKLGVFFPAAPPLLAAQEDARKTWVAAEDEYHAACTKEQIDHPVLAVYSKQDDAATRLEELVGKSAQSLAATLYTTIDDRLKSIKEVREAIGGDYNPWKHSRIVGLTKTQLDLKPWETKVVDEKAAKAARGAEDSMAAKVAAVVAIGLGLLGAIPSGGSTLLVGLAAASAAVGAAYSLNTLYEHYREYSLAKAENLTSLDQAQAISSEEPGLLWLALDLLDLGLNMVAAVKVFGGLRGAMAAAEKGGVRGLVSLHGESGRAGLPPPSRSRLIAETIQRMGGGKSASQVLEQLLEQLAVAGKGSGKATLMEAIDKAALDLAAKKKICFFMPGNAGGTLGEFKRVLREAGVAEAQLQSEAAALMRDFQARGYHGFYSGKGDFVILREGDDMASMLAHELSHRAQHVQGRLQSLGTLRSEYQAHHIQREVLLSLPEDVLASSPSRELVTKTDAELVAYLKSHPTYGPEISAEAADATIGDLDPAADAKLIEDWFLGGAAGR